MFKPLMMELWDVNVSKQTSNADFKLFIKDHVLALCEVSEAQTLEQVIEVVLRGSTVLFIDGISGSLILGTESSKLGKFE